MKRFDANRYVPLGIPVEKEISAMGWGLAILGVLTVQIPWNVITQWGNVAQYGLRSAFWEELAASWSLRLFPYFWAAMAVMAGYHYLYHRREAMSVYLMRRLPSRWEYHRRCLGMPLLGIASSLVLLALLMAVYYLVCWLLSVLCMESLLKWYMERTMGGYR